MNLEQRAKNIRYNILDMIATSGSGHIGGSLSAVELMTVLYFEVLKHQPNKPDWEGRDRVIFSKGHASALLYACLVEAGYFDEKELKTFRKIDSLLQGHPTRNGLAGVEVSTGSLGMGLSVGVGMALAFKQQKMNNRVYVLIGDGECQSGQIWEAAMAAAHYKLNNLCVILDYNGLQIDGSNAEVMSLGDLYLKWDSFEWNVIKVLDGHNISNIIDAYNEANKRTEPTIIIADTIKGKGISFMENKAEWHGKVPTEKLLEKAYEELWIGLIKNNG